jgi:integrase/recombinase XerD
MAAYVSQRENLGYDGLSDAFFVAEQGGHLTYRACWETFAGLIRRTGICKQASGGRPGIHALRHSFTVGRMVEWHRAGLPVKELLPRLSVYLGHVQPAHTYWYLTATPELLSLAADIFQQFAGQGGQDE